MSDKKPKERQTPRIGHAPIEMRRVATEQEVKRRGDFAWVKRKGGRALVIGIPTERGASACEWSVDFKNHCNAQWKWDGNKEKPTLTPSLHWVGAWHGWVRAGFLVEA